MIEEILVLGGLGLAFGTGLVFASRKLAVRVDERVEKIRELLPGTNCGACGFAGCDDFASALVRNTSLVDKCAQVAPDAKEGIGRVLGIAVKLEKPKIARVACTQGSKLAFEYQGARECGVAADLMGGFLVCEDGCLGLGDCARVCPLSAIEIREGKVWVDEGKCTGCGICARVCPRDVIKLVPVDARVFPACNSPKPGKIVAAACSKGCLVCRLCERACEQRAITIENNLPLINLELCNGCGACVEACKRGVLESLGRSQAPAQAG